jgi:hypothetical protein
MLPAKLGSILPSSFRGEDFFKLITRLGVIALFSSFFSSPGPNVRYCHHLACNFEVNQITRLGVIVFFSLLFF